MLSDPFPSVAAPPSPSPSSAPQALSTRAVRASAQAPHKAVRLRLACDACTTAKVKCSKTSPCERCVDNEEECRYSASRRHGKRSRHRKNTEVDSETPLFSPSASTSGIATPAISIPASRSTTALAGPSSAGGLGGSTILAYTDFPWGDDNDEGGGLRINAGTRSSNATSLSEELEDWLHRDMDMDITFDMDSNGLVHTSHPWTTPPESIISQPHISSETLSPHTTSIMRASSERLQLSHIQTAQDGHGCEAQALSILQSLHHGPSSDHSDCMSNPSVDRVLVANQAALTRLAPLLTCPCSRNPHIALLHGAILSKIMFWYRVGVTGRGQAEGVAVVPLRPMEIQLGMLDLDTDDQETLQRTVLLRELRKAERILRQFDAYLTRDEHGTTCRSMAMQKIQEELDSIIREIKQGQNE